MFMTAVENQAHPTRNTTDQNDQNYRESLADRFSKVFDNEWRSAFEGLQMGGFTGEKAINELCKLVKVSN